MVERLAGAVAASEVRTDAHYPEKVLNVARQYAGDIFEDSGLPPEVFTYVHAAALELVKRIYEFSARSRKKGWQDQLVQAHAREWERFKKGSADKPKWSAKTRLKQLSLDRVLRILRGPQGGAGLDAGALTRVLPMLSDVALMKAALRQEYEAKTTHTNTIEHGNAFDNLIINRAPYGGPPSPPPDFFWRLCENYLDRERARTTLEDFPSTKLPLPTQLIGDNTGEGPILLQTRDAQRPPIKLHLAQLDTALLCEEEGILMDHCCEAEEFDIFTKYLGDNGFAPKVRVFSLYAIAPYAYMPNIAPNPDSAYRRFKTRRRPYATIEVMEGGITQVKLQDNVVLENTQNPLFEVVFHALRRIHKFLSEQGIQVFFETDDLNVHLPYGKSLLTLRGPLGFDELGPHDVFINDEITIPGNISKQILEVLCSFPGIDLHIDQLLLSNPQAFANINKCEGSIHYGGTQMQGVVLPKQVQGSVCFYGLKSAKEIMFPQFIGNVLNLTSLTTLDGLTFPKGFTCGCVYVKGANLKLTPNKIQEELHQKGLPREVPVSVIR